MWMKINLRYSPFHGAKTKKMSKNKEWILLRTNCPASLKADSGKYLVIFENVFTVFVL